MYETNRVVGEKLGLNTKETCWYYERWQADGKDRLCVKSWNKKGREWGEVTRTSREGRKVTYWKEEGSERKIGEYSLQGSSECMKKLQAVNFSSSYPSYHSEFTLKSPSCETGTKLHLHSDNLQHTKWETTTKPYQEEPLELTFSDLEEDTGTQENSEEYIHAKQDYVEMVENCRETMAEMVEGTVGIVRRKGGQWREVEELEDCLTRLKGAETEREGRKVVEVMKEISYKQQTLISSLLYSHLPHSSNSLDTFSDSYTPNPSKLRLSFGPVLDTSDLALQEEPLELEDASSTTISLGGGIKTVPRRKVRSGLNALGKIQGRLERRKLMRVMKQWREEGEIRGSGSFVGMVSSPKSYLWANHPLESMFEEAAEQHISPPLSPSFLDLFESLIQQEYAYLHNRSHLQHCYKRKGDPSQPSIGEAIFPIFEELMDKKYDEVVQVRGKGVPVSLSQFFCEHLVPRKGFTRLQLKRFSQFMHTLLSMHEANHPYGTFICRLLRVEHPHPIFDTAGRLITQIRYELLRKKPVSAGLQYYADIRVAEAVQAAKAVFGREMYLFTHWLQALTVADLTLSQRSVYWISQFIALSETLVDFTAFFSSNSVSFDQFQGLKRRWPLSSSMLASVFHQYAVDTCLTLEEWERLVTDGDFLRLKYPTVPLWVVFEAVLEAFEALQRKITAQVAGKMEGKEGVNEEELGDILAMVLPGLQSDAYTEIYSTAQELSSSKQVSAASIIQSIIRLKLETR